MNAPVSVPPETLVPAAALPDPGAIDAIVDGRHGDPFAVLGPHPVTGGVAVRCFAPEATSVSVIDAATGAVRARLKQVHPAGFFAGLLEGDAPYRLRLTVGEIVRETEDPYAFPPVLGDLDVHLLAEGRHHDLGRTLGAHTMTIGGVPGVRFAVWAPNARRVSVVGPFNRWDGRRHPMRLRFGAGVWEIFIPRLPVGTLYKYEIVAPDGGLLPLKADPVAWAAEAPPATASVVADTTPWRWRDEAWMADRAARSAPDAPISVYEVHAQSWLHPDGAAPDWDVLIDRLVPYAAQMGFTHIELLPIMEHPFGGSWGYQPLGQFAPTARLGKPEQFARFVDACHQAGVGVILDWVPAHFPTDAHGLAHFDGTALYEHADPREGFHYDWNTLIYNLGRNEVRGFLIGSALHWLEHYHVDALRVDAVASMLYRDYSRKAGEWIPNKYGGRENLESVAFLQDLSDVVNARCPGAMLIAEESTAWPGVTRSPRDGGLGFHYKWNMGWMHDTLHYMQEEPINRRWHHDSITFGLVYAFSERFMLPLSHDEVVYGKGSLIGKMPGDAWQRFANLRAYFGFMWTHPGKKLLFMGGEIAQTREWDHDGQIDWHLLDDPAHAGVQRLVRDLNHVYRQTPALHTRDADDAAFRWVVLDDREQSVFAYLRDGRAGEAPVLVVFNATPVPRPGYRVGVPAAGVWHEILNTDAAIYGGSNLGNAGAVTAEDAPLHGLPASVSLLLPPLATVILRHG
ncbi:1,4-alpha-glucan branching protein GlgB [Acidisphaera rubrifaciens]|uniref:1,4-alpha-glucan branching enzyme GlgB n=1 Tax=Acidisphaera rubrifaciens HS-AP3 TaxID=1231350 RepID=A0A0D6P877_9PROT|nr:1,4-alpha-glucan branching protein GlgB [Acidisphaera rubrifaciens]GAN77546.1 glycogen branching enzyme [Acidisphaera rubrifaciens HS-AP3]